MKKPRPRWASRPGPNRIPPIWEGLNGTSLAGRGVYVQPTDRSAALDGNLPRLGSLHFRQVQRQHAVLELGPDAARVHLLADAKRPEVVAGLALHEPRLAFAGRRRPAGVQRQLAVFEADVHVVLRHARQV